MASWRSSSSARSSSPASPMSPVPPHNLPQWLRSTRRSTAVIPPGRYKVLIAAFSCILLGWLVTSTLTPRVQPINEDILDASYLPSNGILDGIEGYAQDEDNALSSSAATPSSLAHGVKPNPPASEQHPWPESSQGHSIKGALGDLHKAMSDKIHGWSLHGSPTDQKPRNGTLAASLSNTTETTKEGLSEAERLGARTRIGKCTILFNGNGYWERAIRTHEAHDRIHNYRMHVLRQHILDDVWSKPAYILSLLLRELAKPDGERLDWLFWVDADTIILNPYVPIEVFLPPADFDQIHLLYSEDWNGLNNGVFPIRVNKWAVELFSAIVTYRYYRPEGDLQFRDQSAMNTLMREKKFVKNVMKLPQRWFNAYQGEHNETLAPYQIRRGDFLVHFAGVIDREPRMSFWLDRADQHLDDWEVPLKSTSYPQEVRDFWADQRTTRANLETGLSETRVEATAKLTDIDEQLGMFSERLSPEQVESIRKAQAALRTFLADEAAAEDLDKLQLKIKEVEDASIPLINAKADSHKVLMGSAHDAIFAADRDLLEAGFYTGITSPELNTLDDLVKKLKEMVLASGEAWNKAALTAAVDNITAARAKVQEKAAVVAAAAAAAAAASTSAAAVAQAAQAEDAIKKLAEQKLKAAQNLPGSQALGAAQDVQAASGVQALPVVQATQSVVPSTTQSLIA